MQFEWDPAKSRAKLGQTPRDVYEAATVLGDSLAATYADPDHLVAEERFITVGISNAGRVLIVAHVERGENLRIISARAATRAEREYYEEHA